MRLFHTLSRSSVTFDDPNLVSTAGLVPVLGLAQAAGLRQLADEHVRVPTDRGANAGLKLTSLVAGMVAGADSIDDLALLRHGGMSRVLARAYAPSTLGSFLGAFTFGHVRQLDAVASRFLTALATRAPLLPPPPACPGPGGFVYLDIDDTIIEVHGHAKQGASFGYTRVRGLNALIATASSSGSAPVIVAQRLRRGAANSRAGAGSLLAQALNTTRSMTTAPVLLRADSAYYARPVIHAARRAGACVSVTLPQNNAGHSQKEQATRTFKKTFGYHPIGVWCENTQELLAASLRTGNAGSNTAIEHADVAEITGLLTLSTWPVGIRVIVRREHPHPGAQLSSSRSATRGATKPSSPTPRPGRSPSSKPGTAPTPVRPHHPGSPPSTSAADRDVALGQGRRRDLHHRDGHPNAHLRPGRLT